MRSWPPKGPQRTARKFTPEVPKASPPADNVHKDPMPSATAQDPPSSALMHADTTTKFSPKTTLLASPEQADDKTISNSISEYVSEEHRAAIGRCGSTVQTTPVEETLVEKAECVGNTGTAAAENVSEIGRKKGVKKVVKKTVRIVKKVVRRKVLKQVQMGSSDVIPENLGADNDVAKDVSSVPDEVEIKNSHSVDSVSMEVDSFNPNETVSLEIENPESNFIVSMEDENSPPNPSASVSMEIEKPNAHVSRKLETQKEFEVSKTENEGGKGICVENISEVSMVRVGDNLDLDEGEKGICVTEALLEDQNMDLTGQNNKEQRNENENSDKCASEEAKKNELSDLEVETRLSDGALEAENANSASVEGEEGIEGQVEDSEVGGLGVDLGFGDKVLLSAEMEALERRRRRQREIFIGGLDKETQDEDIRKVFEEVGEVIDVRVVRSGKTGKNKGFAFVTYASAADAKTALVKYHKVQICGKECNIEPAEGNDTIFLGNIDKKWNSEDVLERLQEIGIEKIDKVTAVADPKNTELNRGFAFLEFETKRDAQTAYNKLQKKDVFGKRLNVRVTWAKPLSEPDENEMLKGKSLYVECIPSSWDEEKVKNYFKRFGEIETVALGKDLHSFKRKDLAFVNYKSREAALACIKAFSHGQLNDEGSQVNMQVCFAKSTPRDKQKQASKPTSWELPKEKQKAAQTVTKPHDLRKMGKSTRSRYGAAGGDRRSSITAELVQLLREQASWTQARPGSSIGSGSVDIEYLHPSPGGKRPFALPGNDSAYSDPRGYRRPRLENPYAIVNPRLSSQGVSMTPLSNRNAEESFFRVENPRYFQARDRAPYNGSTRLYHRH